jgi:hypothetical protein
VNHEPFEGPLTVQVNDTQRVIAHDLATLLHCVTAPDD